jgi:phage gp29-like protein
MDLWSMSVDSIAKTIADTVNQHAIPRLLRLNGMDSNRPPTLQYSEVAHIDLTEISDFISKMAAAGVLAPDPTLEDHLRDLAGLPPANHDVDETGVDTMSPEDMRALMALPPQQRIVAERTGIVPDQPAFPGGNPPFGGSAPEQSGADEPEE